MKLHLTVLFGLLIVATGSAAVERDVTIRFQGNGCRFRWEVAQTWQHYNGWCNGSGTNGYWSGEDYGTTNIYSTTAGTYQSPAMCNIYPTEDAFGASYAVSFSLWDGSQYVLKQQSTAMGDNGGGSYTVNFNACSTNSPTPDAPDGASCPDPGCGNCGMPGWRVSEPHISLWLNDEPLGYQPSNGPRVALELAYKQREDVAGQNSAAFSVGRKWNFSWFSFVMQDVNSNKVAHFPNGRQIAFQGASDYLTNTRLTGDTTNGFTISYPDGQKDVYGCIITNTSGGFVRALLSERWNAQSQKTTLNYFSYTPGGDPVVRLQNVVDGDGRTNLIYYVASNGYSTNLISQVVDAFGRTNSYAYDNNGYLTNITDVAGMSSSFAYDSNNWITNLTTPYGTTSFQFTDSSDAAPIGRSVLVTEPNGAKQLYLCTNALALSASYATNEVPVTSPFTNTLDNADLNVRNSFHWDARQYAALSTTNVSAFTTNDLLKGRMHHWLKVTTNSMGSTLSLSREPSPDSAGTIEGQKIWYDYAGKTNSAHEGNQSSPLFVARVLPDGTSAYVRTDRNGLGIATNEVNSYSSGGTVYQRTNIYAYATNGIDLITVTNALGVQVSSNAYNAYHQVMTNINALNETTSFTYNTNQQLTSITRPNGLVTTNIYFTSGTFTNWLDRTMDFYGSNYFRTNSFIYGTNGLLLSQTDERGLTDTNYWDNLQRPTGRLYADGTTTSNLYCRLDGQSYANSSGGTNLLDLTATKDRLGDWTYFAYDSMRRKTYETNALGTVTAYSYCQCGALESTTFAANTSAAQTINYAYDNQGNTTVIGYPDGSGVTNKYDSLRRLTNVSSGFASVTNYYNNQGLATTSSNAFGRIASATFDFLDRATNSVDANAVTITSTYDNLNRLLTRGFPDGGIEKYGYTLNIAGVTTYTNQLGSNVVNYAYDALGRKTNEVNPGITTNNYTYSAAGDLLTLTDGKSQVTRWNYDQYGRATNKVDATSTEILRYQYDAGNRLTNRWSASKGNTTYRYDAIGNLTNVVYPVSPAITMKYDALNRLTNMVDAVGTTVYGYANQFLASEDGPWANDTVSYGYTNGMRNGITLLAPNASSWSQSYVYDAGNRLQTLSSPAGSFAYTYKGPGNVVTNLSLPNGSAITNAFDNVARLTGTWLKNSGGTILNSHSYGYNFAGQRTAVTNIGGNYLNYSYDLIGELKTASGKESGGSSRLQEQFGYAYDAAGNLNYRTNNALVQTFAANNLNELSTVTRSGTLTVAGGTSSAATNVTVNGSAASRYGDNTFALAGFTVTNGNNTFTAIAQDSYGRKDTNSVNCNLPSSVSFVYDSNGNLTSDGTRGFDYDDENQLIRVAVTNSWKSEFTYDGKFRRRIRKEFTWQNSAWLQTCEVRYIYEGNVVLQERDGNNLPAVTYTRGRDLSGSLDGAGGIGGLLSRTDAVNGQTAWYHADGNGNVTAMVNLQQLVVGRYVYDPFGNTLSKAGPLADANAYRFSSQDYHQNSGLVLYLCRAYDPNLQRWLSRDPLRELADRNLYRYVGNNAVNYIDPTGEAPGTATTYQNLPPTMAFGGGAPATYGYPVAPNLAGVQLLSIAGEATAATFLTLAPEPSSKAGAVLLWADAYDNAIALGSGNETYYQQALEWYYPEITPQDLAISLLSKDAGLFVLGVGSGLKPCPTKAATGLPKTRAAVHIDLRSKGFEYKSTSPSGYVTYKGSDGRTVTIKPSGEVIPTQRVPKADGTGNFPQRQDYNGNPLPDQSHSSGHFVEPLEDLLPNP